MKKKKSKVILKDKEIGHFVSKKRLFIKSSRFNDKQMQRMEFILRTLISVGLVILVVALFVFVFVFLIPYLQTKISGQPQTEESQLPSEVSYEPTVSYDEMGLPILDNSISLQIINAQNPADNEREPVLKTVSGIEVRAEIATALKTMVGAMKEDGLTVEFEQGYVSYQKQQDLYNQKVKELIEQEGLTAVMAKTNAKKEVPVAGQSDFQTGMCIKIKADSENFSDSDIYKWLKNNMEKYGFIFRYPSGSKKSTGLEDDETVIRYVGQKNAETMRMLAMSLEEYVAYLKKR